MAYINDVRDATKYLIHTLIPQFSNHLLSHFNKEKVLNSLLIIHLISINKSNLYHFSLFYFFIFFLFIIIEPEKLYFEELKIPS